MGYIQGEGRNQATLFPVVLDDFVPANHMCRVIDAFVAMLVMSHLGFERNNQGDGSLFGREALRHEPDTDTYVCPGNKGCYARTPIIRIVTPCIRLRLATAASVR
jgi:hypothetical protein